MFNTDINTNNKFITFEGIDGCGKTTQSKRLSDHLESLGEPVIVTSELNGTGVYEKFKDILMNYNIEPLTEILLVMAARHEHLQLTLLPAFHANKWVICDRFIDSTASYQGQYRGFGIDGIYELHHEIIPGIQADITFFIDLDVEESIRRANYRDSNSGIPYEGKCTAKYQRIKDHFTQLLNMRPDRIVRIDANGLSAEEVHAKVVEVLRERKII